MLCSGYSNHYSGLINRSEYPKTYKTSIYHKISSMSNSHTQSYLPLNVSVLPGITITDR